MLGAIETPRLVLRKPKPEDAGPIFTGYAQDAEVVRFMLWPAHASIAETRGFVQKCIEAWAGGIRFPWTITARNDNTVLGMIELGLEIGSADVGFVLRRNAWGSGYGTEALSAVLTAGLSLPEIRRIWAICHVENRASARVMEKAGMLRESLWPRYETFPNVSQEPQDVYCYAKIRL